MTRLAWIRSPRRLLILFLRTGVLLVCALLCLGWQLAWQDCELADQWLQEQRENAADWSVSVLSGSLSKAEEQLGDLAAALAARIAQDAVRLAAGLPDDAVLVVYRGVDFNAYPAESGCRRSAWKSRRSISRRIPTDAGSPTWPLRACQKSWR